ncbi:MAG: PTS sugar transporter subunit IIC [Bacillota bacterium]
MFVQALLIGAWAWFAGSTFAFGIGFSTFIRPMIGGLVTGIILGDWQTGLQVGATINLIYLGFISAGGATPADINVAGVVGTAVAILSGQGYEVGLAVAVPAGLLSASTFPIWMTVNSAWVQLADKFAGQGNTRGVALMNIWPAQILNMFRVGLPVFLAVYYGADVVQSAVAAMPQQFMAAMRTVGGMLPAIGFGMLLKAMGRKSVLPFFFAGFIMFVYLKLDIIAIAALGVIIALMHDRYTSQKPTNTSSTFA